METPVLLSVITPVFNGGEFLRRCIDNVAKQSVSGIEHLIIDGGSTDNSLEILKELSGQHTHIRWISESDNGQSDAMNKGIHLAKGKWISFLNVDDFYEADIFPSVIEKIIKVEDEIYLLVGNLKIWNEKDELIKVNIPSQMRLSYLLADICEWPFNPSAYFYPKSIHDLIGYFPENEHYAMDYDFILKTMVAKIPIRYFNETWGNFRLLPTAKTGKDQSENQSYNRAKALRMKYLMASPIGIQFEARVLRIFWALRNKIYGKLFK